MVNMATFTDEDINTAFIAGISAACIELVMKVADIAINEYKTDPRYLDDFHISLRDIKQITKRIQGGK